MLGGEGGSCILDLTFEANEAEFAVLYFVLSSSLSSSPFLSQGLRNSNGERVGVGQEGATGLNWLRLGRALDAFYNFRK